MKKIYSEPTFEELELVSENGFLVGSVTTTPIQINEVKVQPFEDGFANEGGFKDINFD